MKKVNHRARSHAVLSASSAARWLACPPSALAAELYQPQGTAYTMEGTQAHEVAEILARGTVDPENIREALNAEPTQEMIEHGMEYREYIHEHVKDRSAMILLEQKVDFSYWVPDGFGTCDCIIIQGDTMTVIDYKYGVGVPVNADGNPQMMLYALGALNDYGFAYDIEHIEMHIFQPRINNISVAVISVQELLDWAEDTVKPIAEKAAQGEGDYKAGSHCKFCPHAGKCKALAAECTAYVLNHGGKKTAVQHLAAHEVAEVLQMAPMIELWLKRVKDQALTDLMNGESVPGYKAVVGRSTRDWADELEVRDVLMKAGYFAEDITKTELLSVAAMEKALGKKKVQELVGGQIMSKPGAPTIAPEGDKRPAYNREAEIIKDFE